MTTYISLLRGINVSGQKKIRMADLRQLYEELGYGNVRSYIQSGNVLFESSETNGEKLAGQIEQKIRDVYEFDVVVFVRAAENFRKLIARNAFVHERNEDPSKLHVTFLKIMPTLSAISALNIADAGNDEFEPGESEIYFFCPDGYGRTKYSNSFVERKLKTPATTRNWKTVNKLYKMTGK